MLIYRTEMELLPFTWLQEMGQYNVCMYAYVIIGVFQKNTYVYKFLILKFICMHGTPLRPYITSGMILTLNDWLNNYRCFSVSFYDSCC